MNLADKYPEAYLEHFIAMFNGPVSEAALVNHIDLAKSMEGTEYLEGLLSELKTMREDVDEEAFINIAREYELRDFQEQHLQFLLDELTRRKT